MAINVHFFKSDLTTIETRLLACVRLKGVIDNEVLAKTILSILIQYDILDKVVAITTDNGADFKAAFSNYGDNYSEYRSIVNMYGEDEDNEHVWLSDSENENDDVDDCDENDLMEVMPINELVCANAEAASVSDDTNEDFNADKTVKPDFVLHDTPDLENLEYGNHLPNRLSLPPRIACAAHTLNLIGKVDAFNAFSDQKYQRSYTSTFKVLNVIWNKSTVGRKNSELFEQYLNKKIIKPHRIRWNRIYDAVSIGLALDT